MRKRYVVKGDKLAGLPALTLEGSATDICLVGERGEIWEYSPGVFKGYRKNSKGDEILFKCVLKDLRKWRTSLKIPFTAEAQLKLAK